MHYRSAWLPWLLALGLSAGGAAVSVAQTPSGPSPAAGAASGAAADPQQRVVITVNEESLTAADIDKILQSLPPQSREYYSGEGRHLLPQFLVRLKVLLAEARKGKLDQRPEVRDTIELATESILAAAERKQIEQSISAPPDLVAQLYESRKKQFEEVRLRRLLIRTEGSILSQSSVASRPALSPADARKKLEDLRRQILDGADFAELARANSDDPASAPAGGDMGFATYQSVIPPIAQAAAALAPGKVSEIIATPYGLELIQVVEKRTKPLEEVRPELEAQLRQGKLEEKMQELQSQYKISIDQDYFNPKNAAPAPSGP